MDLQQLAVEKIVLTESRGHFVVTFLQTGNQTVLPIRVAEL